MDVLASALEFGVESRGSLAALPTTAPVASRCSLASHSLVHLDEDLVMDIDLDSGRYCVLRLGRDALALTAPLFPLASGNLYTQPCVHSSCTECVSEAGCGWCSETSQCLQGGPIAPCGGGCKDHWTVGYCADWPCSHHAGCEDCLASKLCGFAFGASAWGTTMRRTLRKRLMCEC